MRMLYILLAVGTLISATFSIFENKSATEMTILSGIGLLLLRPYLPAKCEESTR